MHLLLRGVFFDISKVFDNAWYDWQLHKLKGTCLNADLLKFMETFLSGIFQKVLLNGKTSRQRKSKAETLKGFILSLSYFLFYIIDIPSELCCLVKPWYSWWYIFIFFAENVNENFTILNKDLEKKTNRHISTIYV